MKSVKPPYSEISTSQYHWTTNPNHNFRIRNKEHKRSNEIIICVILNRLLKIIIFQENVTPTKIALAVVP